MRLDQEGFGSLSAVLAIASHRNGRQFFMGLLCAAAAAALAGKCACMGICGRTFRRLWGMSVPFSLSAPLLCQTIVAILCGNFEQFANKRLTCEKRVTEKFADFSVTLKFRIMICVTPQRTLWQCRRCAWRPLHTSPHRSSRRIPGSARHRPP